MSGDRYEGETPPTPTKRSRDALTAWNMLHNGQNAVDWNGLEVAIELLGVSDVEGLIESLVQVKAWKKPDGDAPPAPDEDDGE